MKRSGKFYRKNEKEVMISLGLKPTINSGSGPIEKEDGQNENIICQLKSTDKNSISIKKQDIDTLLYNASVSHKIPVFAIQFLQTNEVYLLFKPDDLPEVNEYLKTGEVKENEFVLSVDDIENAKEEALKIVKSIKSSSKAREKFNKENEEKFKKKRRNAK